MIGSMRSVLPTLLLLSALTACTAARPPAYNLPAADALVAGETYTVGRNENIYAIAQKQGVKMRDIIALNELKPPFALYTGQKLTLPNKDRFAAPTPKAAPRPTRDDFRVGDRVSFEDRHLQTRIGTIVRINQKTASINCENEPGWRVPFGLLRHLIDL